MEAVRPAIAADLARLEVLIKASVAASSVERAASLFRHPHRLDLAHIRLGRALEDADTLLLAGLIEDYVVGVALVTLDTSAGHGTVGVVEELFVEPGAREVGLGEALLDASVDWCRSRNCVGIDIATLPGDRSAKNLCERSGFLARTLIMHHKLT